MNPSPRVRLIRLAIFGTTLSAVGCGTAHDRQMIINSPRVVQASPKSGPKARAEGSPKVDKTLPAPNGIDVPILTPP